MGVASGLNGLRERKRFPELSSNAGSDTVHCLIDLGAKINSDLPNRSVSKSKFAVILHACCCGKVLITLHGCDFKR